VSKKKVPGNAINGKCCGGFASIYLDKNLWNLKEIVFYYQARWLVQFSPNRNL
jgi:hypothetical protein